MTLITAEIGEFILRFPDSSAKQLSTQISNKFKIEINRETIRRFINNPKRHYLPTKEISTFEQFMKKLESSNCESAKLLKEKLNLSGKYKKVNQDRIYRIIQYTLNILQE